MKRIFAMALVGLLSISSLAEEENLNPYIDPYMIIEVEKPCPAGFTKIEDKENKAGGGFCITSSSQKSESRVTPKQNCAKHVYYGTKAFLCSSEQWSLACKNNGEELKMKNKSGSVEQELVDGFIDDWQIKVSSDCDTFVKGRFKIWTDDYGSRCCFR
jgi:hypothetical protein